MMGGRIAEEIFLGHMTTGAGNDIEKATEMARKMVCEWGMSELGPLTFGKPEQEIFLGRDFGRHAGLLRGDGEPDRRRGQADRDVRLRARPARSSTKTRRRCTGSPGPSSRRKSWTASEILAIIAEESGVDISKLRKSGPPKPPILPGPTPEVAGGNIGPLVPEPA